MKKNGVNQKSIAKSLNLSTATVSKALNDSSEINSTTREKVVNMATKLGYDFVGRSKEKASKDKSKFVGVLIHSRPDEWQHTTYFAGMSEKCARFNVSLMLHYFGTDDCELVLDPEYQPPVMREGKLSGLILVNRWPAHVVKRLTAQLPCVSIVHQVHDAFMDTVGIDDISGMSMLMDHLYELGHRKIGFFARCSALTWSRERFGAYMDSLCRLGLAWDSDSVCDVPVEHLENKSLAMDASVECVAEQIHRGVRAWMCASDWAGYLLCKGLKERGFEIPQDVSITGFDNIENNRLGCDELTSVAVPAVKIGAEALRRLMTRLRHPTGPQLHVKLQCKLVEAMTTAGPPAE